MQLGTLAFKIWPPELNETQSRVNATIDWRALYMSLLTEQSRHPFSAVTARAV